MEKQKNQKQKNQKHQNQKHQNQKHQNQKHQNQKLKKLNILDSSKLINNQLTMSIINQLMKENDWQGVCDYVTRLVFMNDLDSLQEVRKSGHIYNVDDLGGRFLKYGSGSESWDRLEADVAAEKLVATQRAALVDPHLPVVLTSLVGDYL